MRIKRLTRIVLVLSVITPFATVACAQRPVQGRGAAITKPQANKITVSGKILYMKAYGGYFVQGEVPARMFFIVNENPKILEELFKSKKTITIEGLLTIGADHLFIEKIDGQTYQGKE
jgi:hypothetical protein